MADKACAACGGEMKGNTCTVCGWVDHDAKPAKAEAPAEAPAKKAAKKKGG